MNRIVKFFLKFLGEIGFWKLWSRGHIFLYRRTGGRIGKQIDGMSHLLLTTTGRRSGQARTVALSYMPEGRDYVIAASNGGADRPPAWWLNLRARPTADIQIDDQRVAVTARMVDQDERARLWPKLKAANRYYPYHESNTVREIPVIVLSPAHEQG